MDTQSRLAGEFGLNELGLDLLKFADGLPGGFFVYEAYGDERILFANKQMASIFGCADVQEFLEHVGGSFTGVVYHEDLMRIEDSIWSQINSGDSSLPTHRDHVTYRIVDKSGSLHFMDEYGRLVKNTAFGDLFFVFVADTKPVTSGSVSRGNADIRMHVSPDIDSLTGLHSMRYYHNHTAEFLARAAAENTRMVDIFFDVDHFKTVNYRLGYDAGDEILQHIASILEERFSDGLLARFSDDHFVLVTRREGIEERLGEVHDRVARLISHMPIEIKAGIYPLDKNDVSIAFAHDRAKVACNSIKGRFDYYYRFYDESLSVNEDMRDYVIGHIEEASQKGWIRNYYQPVVRVVSKLCCSMEALSRWKDPELGTLAPSQYVQYLEDARLIHLLDRAVVNRACSDLKTSLKRFGHAVPISLNFSPNGLSLLDVPELVGSTVDAYDLPHDLVHVEITESSLTEDPELLRSVIQRLHKRDFAVWMDDFGSGYSSFNLLKDYDFDVLKIDMEFLRGMEGNEKSRTIVRSISNLAHRLGMLTLVEGVESKGQFEFLRDVGADMAQGFLFSAPVPYDVIINDFFLRYPPERH